MDEAEMTPTEELRRFCELLTSRGIEFQQKDDEVTFKGCWMTSSADGDKDWPLYGGYGFLPWECGHFRNAEHALDWLDRWYG